MNRPVLFVTNHAPAYRVPAFLALHEREGVEFALVGGEVRHGGGSGDDVASGLPARRVGEREILALAASGRYRAVVAGLSGRIALPAAHLGARRARVPFVLWATIWAHPRTAMHALSYLPLRRLYSDADAIVTYGPHVSAYVRAKGARAPVFEAAQAVDNAFWSAEAGRPERRAPFQALFAGRRAPEKGLEVLEAAWTSSGLAGEADAALVRVEGRPQAEVRNFYAGSDVLVLPSVPTRDFLEPWGLVVNEAMNQGLPVIATTAVGAAAGGLVRDGRTGLVVAPRDPAALGAALRRMHDDRALRRRLGEAGRQAVRAFTFTAWADGMVRGLEAAGVARSGENGLLA